MKRVYIITVLILLGCSNLDESRYSNNKIDLEFKIQFDNCIEIISLRQIGFVPDFWSTVYAFECLTAITNVKSNVIADGDTPYFYPTTDDKDYTDFFYEDLIKWNSWFEENKVTMNMSKADSLMKIHSNEIGDEIEWPKPYTQLFLE